jgi:hypothetical protein
VPSLGFSAGAAILIGVFVSSSGRWVAGIPKWRMRRPSGDVGIGGSS